MKNTCKYILCLLIFSYSYISMADTFSGIMGLPEKFSAIAFRYVDGNKASIKIGIMYSQPVIRLTFMVQPNFKEVGITIANVPSSIVQIDLQRNAYYDRKDILLELNENKLSYFDYILLSGNSLSVLSKKSINNETTEYLIRNIFFKNDYIFVHNRLTGIISIYNTKNEMEGEITTIVQLPQNYDISNIPHGIPQKDIPLQLNYRKE